MRKRVSTQLQILPTLSPQRTTREWWTGRLATQSRCLKGVDDFSLSIPCFPSAIYPSAIVDEREIALIPISFEAGDSEHVWSNLFRRTFLLHVVREKLSSKALCLSRRELCFCRTDKVGINSQVKSNLDFDNGNGVVTLGE